MGSKNININRRHFLKGATAAAVLSSFGMYGFEIMNREKPWRVGLIGTGWYGTSDLFKLISMNGLGIGLLVLMLTGLWLWYGPRRYRRLKRRR